METLVTGHVQFLSKKFYQQLKKHSRLVVVGEGMGKHSKDERVKHVRPNDWQEHLPTVLSAHAFDNIVYFLNRPEEVGGKLEEVEELVHLLDACTTYRVKKIVVVSAAYTYREGGDRETDFHSSAFLQESRILSTCDDLCQMYKERYELPLTVLHVPYLFSSTPGNSYISQKLKELVLENDVVLDGFPNQTMDFLSQQDLAVLIERVLLEPQKDIANLDVPGAARLTVQELAEVLRSKRPSVNIRFSGRELFISPPVNSEVAFQEYQWSPEMDVRDEIDVMLDNMEKNLIRKRIPFKERWQHFNEKYPFALIGMELVAGYFLMQYLNDWATTLLPFRTIDFRLLFVVIFASVHGHKAGILAAILAEMALFMDYQALELDWRILFYNVENWIPFVIYLVVGAVLGYVRDQNRIKRLTLTEENEDIVERYVFLNDMYDELLANKLGIEKQIISSQENFGRLFSTLRKLEQAQTSVFFLDALHAVEELLDMNTLSFYQLADNSGIAHRIIGSSGIQGQLPQKMVLEEEPEFHDALRNNEVWINKTQKEGAPDFTYPIYHNGKLEILMNVHGVPFEQMNANQEDLFKMAGSLVNASLQRIWTAQQEGEPIPAASQIFELDQAAGKQPGERKSRSQRHN